MDRTELIRAKTEFADKAVNDHFDPESFLADAGSDVSVDTHMKDLHGALGKLKALDRADKPFDVEYDALLAFTILKKFHSAVAAVFREDKAYEAALANSGGPSTDDWRKSLEPDDVEKGGSRKFTSDPSVRAADEQIHKDSTKIDGAVSESLRKDMEKQRDEAEKSRSEGKKDKPEEPSERRGRSHEVNLPKEPKKFGHIESSKKRYESAVRYAAKIVLTAVCGNKEGARLAPLVDTLQVAVWGELEKLCNETAKLAQALRYPEDGKDFADD